MQGGGECETNGNISCLVSITGATSEIFCNTLVSTLTKLLNFQIAYISNHTREFCSKVGRELLSSIAQRHPFILSFLLQGVRDTVEKIGMVQTSFSPRFDFVQYKNSNLYLMLKKKC